MATASSETPLKSRTTSKNTGMLAKWARLLGYLKKYRLWVLTALFGIIGSNLLAVAVPYILRDVVDIGIEKQDSNFMLNAGLLVAGLGVLRGFSAFFGRFLESAFPTMSPTTFAIRSTTRYSVNPLPTTIARRSAQSSPAPSATSTKYSVISISD